MHIVYVCIDQLNIKYMDTIAEFSDNVGLTCKLTKVRFYVSSLVNDLTFS